MAGSAEAGLTGLSRTPLIWVIDAGLPGVTNQCLGIARAVATLGPCRIETVRMRLRSRTLQPLFRWALRRGFLDGGGKFLARLFFSMRATGTERPDLVVSALGRSEFSGAFLRRAAGAISVHIGVPGRLPPESFDFVVVAGAEETSALRIPHVRLEINPTPVLRADVAEKAKTGPPEWRNERLWAVLVGGDGAGYVYRPEDWAGLAQALSQLGRRCQARYLLTTSRRTGGAAERILRSGMSPGGSLADAVWHAHGGATRLTDYLAAAEIVFCTEDSRSMISDAIAAGKPVYALRPETCAPDPRNVAFLAEQEAKRRVKRLPIDKLAELDVDRDMATWFRPLTECWSAQFVAALTAAVPKVRELLG